MRRLFVLVVIVAEACGADPYPFPEARHEGDHTTPGQDEIGESGLPAPTDVQAMFGDRSVTVDWSPVAGADSYALYWSIHAGVTKDSGARLGNVAPPFAHDGLPTGATYHYIVTASDADGDGAPSSEVSAAPIGPPPRPEAFAAVVDNGTVVLTWDEIPDVTTYVLYWGLYPPLDDDVGDDHQVLGVDSGYVWNGAQFNYDQTYYFAVSALNFIGEGPRSEQLGVFVGEPGPPSAPSITSLTPGNGSMLVEWTEPAGTLTHMIEWDDSPAMDSSSYEFPDEPSYIVTGLTNGVTYYFRVRASNLAGQSPFSPTEDAVPVDGGALPDVPQNLVATGGDTVVQLTWVSSAGASGYTLHWGLAPGSHPNVIDDVTSPHDHTGLVNGTAYYYIVNAKSASGVSGPSAPSSATPDVAPAIFSESFDAGMPAGWVETDLGGTQNVNWEVGTNIHGSAFDGSTYLFADTYEGGEQMNARLESPDIAVPGGGATFSFDYLIWTFPGQTTQVFVYDPGVPGWVELTFAPTSSTTTWSLASFSLGPYAGKTIKLGFAYNGNADTYWHIDNVRVE